MEFRRESYWSRSWALLTKDKGWIKPLLVLSAAQLIPIVGQFGARGYALEWGRLTAWGVDSAPKQKNVDVWACIRTGARAFVVALGYVLIAGALESLVSSMLGDTLGGILGAAINVAMALLITLATLRATIYQRIGAGFGIRRIADMVERDSEGLLRIMGMALLLIVGISVVSTTLLGFVMLANAGSIVRGVMRLGEGGYYDDWQTISLVMGWIGNMLPHLLVAGYLIGVLGSGGDLLVTTATALWMRQFDVQNWGESSDPLPGDPAYVAQTAWAQNVSTQQGPQTSSYVQDVPTAQEVPMPGQYSSAPEQANGYGASDSYIPVPEPDPTLYQRGEGYEVPAYDIPQVQEVEHAEPAAVQETLSESSSAADDACSNADARREPLLMPATWAEHDESATAQHDKLAEPAMADAVEEGTPQAAEAASAPADTMVPAVEDSSAAEGAQVARFTLDDVVPDPEVPAESQNDETVPLDALCGGQEDQAEQPDDAQAPTDQLEL